MLCSGERAPREVSFVSGVSLKSLPGVSQRDSEGTGHQRCRGGTCLAHETATAEGIDGPGWPEDPAYMRGG